MDAQNWMKHREFEWLQPGKPGEGYVLMAGGQLVGKMMFEHWSRESAGGETPFGRWLFTREGFWKPRYIIVDAQTGEEIAVYTPRWSGSEGTLEIMSVGRYRWRMRSCLGGEHELVDESGRTVFVLTRGLERARWTDIFKQQGRIRREDTLLDGKTLSILLLFAWWMILTQEEESANTAALVATMG